MSLLLQISSDATTTELRALLRGDAAGLIFGILLLAVGVVTLVLFAFRRGAKDLALLAFAGFSGLYGARLLVGQATIGVATGVPEEALRTISAYITYVIVFPAFAFWERMLGRGWKSTLRLGVWATVVFAVVAVLVESLLGARGVLMTANNILVIIGMTFALINLFIFPPSAVPGLGSLRLGSLVMCVFALGENLAGLGIPVWPQGYEVIGFFFFTCCLGYAAALRVATNEKKLLAIESELDMARRIQASILPEKAPQLPGLKVTVRYVPAASVAGDFYDFLETDGRRLGALVADVAGHGVPAALIASMIKVAFSAQAEHVAEPARVLAGMNEIFAGQLESQFVTAGYLFLDPGNGVARYAGAGHPALLHWRRSEAKLGTIEENGLVLGPFPHAEFRHAEFPFEPGDRLILCTDGILEASNAAGEFFGDGRFQQLIAEHAGLPAEAFADRLLESVAAWSKSNEAGALEDDLTLLIVDRIEARPA